MGLDRFTKISLGSNVYGKTRQGLFLYMTLPKILNLPQGFLHSFGQDMF